ncbi:hypothetical protein BC940DRAFT_291112 [Gongronella butleri]|nr:hypothetical protein BC940DRAFT_291112 [Gongronella butleri]
MAYDAAKGGLLPSSDDYIDEGSSTLFQDNYDALLQEVLQDDEHDDSVVDIDLDAATAELPDELRAALEDRSLAAKYLDNLRTFMSHQRTRSMSSIASGKGDYYTMGNHHSPGDAPMASPDASYRVRDPLSKALDAVPYQTRLVNGVQSLWELEKKMDSLKIPELDLPSVSETVIKARLHDLYKIQDDLFIHLHGGPLVVRHQPLPVLDKKKREIDRLLDTVAKEIGLYEEFVKRGQYLSLEHILNETDSDDDDDLTDPGSALDSASEVSKGSSLYSPNGSSASSTLRAVTYDRMASSVSSVSASFHSSDSTSDARSLSELFALGEQHALHARNNKGGNDALILAESFKWTALAKISDHLYAKAIRQTSGLVSVMAVSGVIAIGTTRSLVFVYDYSQNLKCVLGDSRRAVELGTVTSLAISADHTTVAVGHSQGHIVVWDVRKAGQAVRTIEPIEPAQRSAAGQSSLATNPAAHQGSPKEGHVKGTAILHLGFIGIKKSELVSGDDQGMAFYHVFYKVVMVHAVDTTRILGRYQNLAITQGSQDSPIPAAANGNGNNGSPTTSIPATPASPSSPPPPKPRRPSTVFALQPLPLGQVFHPAENFGLVALLTPYKMIIVGLKPSPQTQYKFLKPKATGATATTLQSLTQRQLPPRNEHICGCLAWLPVTKNQKAADKQMASVTDPMLAFSWDNHLYILRVVIERIEPSHTSRLRSPLGKKGKHASKLDFCKVGETFLNDAIVGLQWINRQILVLFTPNEEMLLFDPKQMVVTERVQLRTKQLVYHDAFISSLRDLTMPAANDAAQMATLPVDDNDMPAAGANDDASTSDQPKNVEMAYYHSIKGYKGKLFLLGLEQVYVGTLLSWADRILALVRSGDFLHAIRLATAFYNGKWIQTVIGLPDNETQRKHVVGERLMELLVASLNYTFSRRVAANGTNGTNGANDATMTITTALHTDLAKCCVDACLSMNDLEFLFESAYEKFAEHGAQGAFLTVLEDYIVCEQLCDVPPAVMKDLVKFYSENGHLDALERIIWHVRPQSLDIDQIVSVCQREGLYEAMMYVWNRSMDDFVSPLVEMLKVIRHVKKGRPNLALRAESVFDYLRLVLQGRSFPDGAAMSSSRANEARSTVYSFLFSGRCVVWPRVGGTLILTVDDDHATEPTYPYLRLLLRFNTKRFLNALEEAFEDPWLNGGDDMLTSTFEEDVLQGKVISRQIIINTLLDVTTTTRVHPQTNNMNNASSSSTTSTPRLLPSASASTVQSIAALNGTTTTATTISSTTNTMDSASSLRKHSSSNVRHHHAAMGANRHGQHPHHINGDLSSDPLLELYMFIANNLHKYTTFILLPLTTKQKILTRLTCDRYDATRDDREAAVQQLLTVYTPNNEESMTQLYEEAHFWNVLEDIYRRDKKYGKLVETYLKDSSETTSFAVSLAGAGGDQEDHDEILLAKRARVFDCVEWLLDEHSPLSPHQRMDVKNVVSIRIAQFVDMDGPRTARIVSTYFDADHQDVIRRIKDDDDDDDEQLADKLIFSYLRGLLEPAQGNDQAEGYASPPTINEKTSSSPPAMLRHHPANASSSPGSQQQHPPLHISATTLHPAQRQPLEAMYINLMCQFDPSGVYDYLNTKLDLSLYALPPAPPPPVATPAITAAAATADPNLNLSTSTVATAASSSTSSSSTRLDRAQEAHLRTLLASCEAAGVMDAVVCLMEMLGDTQGALDKMLAVGKDKLTMILDMIAARTVPWTFDDQSKMSNALIGLGGVLRVSTRLCEQNDKDDDSIENLWFRLLDIYVEASMEINSALDKKKHPHIDTCLPIGIQQHLTHTFKSFVQSILTSLLLSTSPQVSLPRLLLRLIDAQTKGDTTFEDFRDIFLSMLDTYKYEGQLLQLTNRLFDRDLFHGVQEMVRQRGKGWRPQTMMCSICRGPILDLSLLQPDIWSASPPPPPPLSAATPAASLSTNTSSISANPSSTTTNTSTSLSSSVSLADLPTSQLASGLIVFHCGHAFHRQCLHLQQDSPHCSLCPDVNTTA